MNEHDIRNFLTSYLSQRFETEQPKFLKEVFFNNYECRADLIMVGKNLHGFEIKSEIDSLKRLNLQIPHYESSFEKVTIVCAQKHSKKVLSLIPSSFGLWEISFDKIKVIRNAKKREISKEQLLRNIPVQELKKLLGLQNLKKSGNRIELVNRCEKYINKKITRDYVIKYLVERSSVRTLQNNSVIKRHYPNNTSPLQNSNVLFENVSTILPRKSSRNPTPRPVRLELDLVC